METSTPRPTAEDSPAISCVAIVVAAGRGVRAGGEIPKQYQSVAGQPVIRMAIEQLLAHPRVDAVCPVIAAEDEALFLDSTLGLNMGLDMMSAVQGGETRQESVFNGLRAIAGLNPATVLIHDAARPFVSLSLVSRVCEGLKDHHGVVPALRVVDTLKRTREDGHITETVARDGLWCAQTPQGFDYATLMQAYDDVQDAFHMTDDATIAEQAGLDVVVVDGDRENFKITTADDFARARNLSGQSETRTGSGFDVHRFCEDPPDSSDPAGTGLRLCGVTIPFERTLAGHSDADVGIHALCDALYGAIGAGDIGVHFPPTEEKWRGASSEVFLAHAAQLIEKCQGRVVNVDVTLICQRPAINPHRAAMGEALAGILGVDVSRVNVKATTTERLGFSGREEGIAAQAVATVSVPLLPQD